ncbi:MAG: hypothetical protein H6797_00615 [Candidatus Nomurabacteria bacterium]|nr:MAG: hypothetical protein H6797_00615 [Candidatus Nomurabacteria bacterium]
MVGVSYTEPRHIDYRKLTTGLDYYENLGYHYMEVPWAVSHESLAVTLPVGAIGTSVQYGELVGSGEQSFIELMRRGAIIAKACCITPCFRIEKSYDRLHHPYFMKLELINTDATQENLKEMIRDAREFLKKFIVTEVEETGPNTYDIVDRYRRIELGSYGFRAYGNTTFIYGTGIALPRLDTVMQHQ